MSAPTQTRPSRVRGGTIVSVAFPYSPIGPKAVGGAEVICSQMEVALVDAGFRSVVVAHAASQPVGELYGTPIPEGVITDTVRDAVQRAHQANLDQALRDHPVVLVHMHGLDFDRYRIPAHIPVLVTLHLPAAWYPEAIWSLPQQYHLVCVSETQRRSCPSAAQPRLQVIGNGVPLPPVEALRTQGRYALMLARICKEKNLHAGLEAARMAGVPAILAGEVFAYPEHLRYFEEQIAPRVRTAAGGHQARGAEAPQAEARFLGPVSGDDKVRLLSRAACLLLPSLAPETSSLVAMEALAAGVPVVGMAVGAVPEIVEHGATGFLIAPGEQATEKMAAALKQVGELNRGRCRAIAEERFPLGRMVTAYLERYRALALPAPVIATSAPRHFASGNEGTRAQTNVDAEAVWATADSALPEIAEAWTHLWREDPHATPFQHPAWLVPWWRQFGPDGKLQLLLLRERGARKLLAMLPMYLYQAQAGAARQLLLLGAGTTDYLDGLWANDSRALACAALRAVLAEKDRFDHVYFGQLRSGSAMVDAAAVVGGFQLEAAEPCAVVSSREALPAKLRANASRYRRRAEAHGSLELRVATTAEEALEDFDALVRFHRPRWEGRGETGVLSDERVCAHHRESLPWLLDAGLLRMFRLTLGGRLLGVLYGLADADHRAEPRLYLYLIGFDPASAALSPGTLLLHAAWNYAQEHGFAAIDLLRGGERYKQFWGATPAPTLALCWTA